MSCSRMDIKNFLRNHGERRIRGFLDEKGNEVPDHEVRKELQQELDKGHKFFPLCGHENFDHEAGWCKGPKA